MIVTVTKEQAAYLASLVQQAHQAQRAYTQVLALLTLGHVEPGATLANIDTENGALEFAEPAPEPEGGAILDTLELVPADTGPDGD